MTNGSNKLQSGGTNISADRGQLVWSSAADELETNAGVGGFGLLGNTSELQSDNSCPNVEYSRRTRSRFGVSAQLQV